MAIGKGRLATLTLLVLASSCGPKPPKPVQAHWSEKGWHYRWDKYRNWVVFQFGDRNKSRFSGVCDSRPQFALYNGDYDEPGVNGNVSENVFTLQIDHREWEIPIARDIEGGGLLIRDSLVDPIADARKVISFRVGKSWIRRFRPSPLLRRMILKCREMRRLDPEALGNPPFAG